VGSQTVPLTVACSGEEGGQGGSGRGAGPGYCPQSFVWLKFVLVETRIVHSHDTPPLRGPRTVGWRGARGVLVGGRGPDISPRVLFG